MKFLKYIAVLYVGILSFSCSDLTDLDINENPNALAPEQAETDFLYNSVIQQFMETINDPLMDDERLRLYRLLAGLTRMEAMAADFYFIQVTPQRVNDPWRNFYAEFLPDVRALEARNGDVNLNFHVGTAKILEAYLLQLFVDVFGDVPYSQAGNGTDVISPIADNQEQLYGQVVALLEEAKVLLADENSSRPGIDLFYNGDASRWIRLANSLLLRLYNQTRLVDGEAGAKMVSIIESGVFIQDEADDFAYQYGSNRDNPDSRAPQYQLDYEAVDGVYLNNYYMWLLVGDKEVQDPRTRFYFYRQVPNYDNADPNAFDCVLTASPFDEIPPGSIDHITDIDPNLPYCVADFNGYYGRDHGNGSGIPPDGDIRAEYGIYPFGGAWDNNSYVFVQQNGAFGAQGRGIFPIWLSSFSDFIRAEAALTAGTGEDARALLESAVRKSIAKVISFEANISSAELNRVIGVNPATGEETLASTLLPTAEDVEAYVAEVLSRYDNSDDKLNVIITEYYIACYGNPYESYNFYRRTGLPSNMQPLLNPQAAATETFPRLLLYPDQYTQRNQNAAQRETTEQVFWDNNSADFIY